MSVVIYPNQHKHNSLCSADMNADACPTFEGRLSSLLFLCLFSFLNSPVFSMSSAVDPCSATFIYEYHYIYVMVCFSTSGSEFARLYGGEDGALGTPSRHQHSSIHTMSLPCPASSLGPGEPQDLPPALIPDRCKFVIELHFNL